MPKISVVLPCYNVEKYIRKGLDSILAQTLQDWEAILVDDGATDSTGIICDEYAKRDCRFRVIHTENQGVSCARNTGMKEAKGELLYFMDPDDCIEPNCFERCYETYKKYDCDIVHFGAMFYEPTHHYEVKRDFAVYEGSGIANLVGPMLGISQDGLNCYYRGESIWKCFMLYGPWICMYNRYFIEQIGLIHVPKLDLDEDGCFIREASCKAKRIVSIPDILYHYYIRNTGNIVRRRQGHDVYFVHFTTVNQKAHVRKMIPNVDLLRYYLGSNVLSCLKLAVTMSDDIRHILQFNSFVTLPDVQEAIHQVCLKNAPIRFAIPVRLLKAHCHSILFLSCWLLRKVGYRLPNSI